MLEVVDEDPSYVVWAAENSVTEHVPADLYSLALSRVMDEEDEMDVWDTADFSDLWEQS